jgi:hypothetical protein
MTLRPPDRAMATEFNPFQAIPFGSLLQRTTPYRFSLFVAAALVGAAVIVSLLEGTFGKWSDFQIVADIKRVLVPATASPSEPTFPFVRDVPTVLLMFTVAATCGLVLKQWQLMKECFPLLAQNGVLTPREEPSLRPFNQHLGLHKVLAKHTAPLPFDGLLDFVNNYMLARVIHKLQPLVFAAAFVIALLLVLGENREIFRVLSPDLESPQRLNEWLQQTYDSWWASTQHTGGFVLYTLMAAFGTLVILLQNLVGFAALYVIVNLPGVAELKVDWCSTDATFGWQAVARIYRTVRWSLTIHGLALSMLVVILGGRVLWISLLVLLWVFVLPLYLVAPFWILRRVARDAKQERISQIRALPGLSQNSDIQSLRLQSWARREIEDVRSAKIRLLSLRRGELPPVVVVVLLPIVLTVIQVLFEIRFGAP